MTTADTPAPARAERMIDEAAAAALVADGMTVFVGGFVASSHPMTIIRQLIRNGVKGLTVVGAATSSMEVDLLIAAGAVKRVVAPYVGIEGHTAIAPFFRAMAQRGELEVREIDEAMYYTALRAGAYDLPYLPERSGVGTDYMTGLNPDLKTITDPFRGETLIAVPALNPDVAFLHAAYGDVFGNISFIGSGFGDRTAARASTVVVVQVEKVISNEDVRRAPERTAIHGVDHIVRAPYGAHPFSSPGFYLQDDEMIAAFVAAGEAFLRKDDDGPIKEFLDEWIHTPVDHVAYLERVGIRQLLSLHEY